MYTCNTVICCNISKNSNLIRHDTMSVERFMKVQGIIVPLSPGSSHPFLSDCLTLNMNQALGSAHPVTQPNISEGLKSQVLCCGNLDSCFSRRHVCICVYAGIALLMIGVGCATGTLSSHGW